MIRLIDANALKEAFTEECCGCCDNCSHCLTGYKCELIDNAPTVDTFTFDDMKKGINVGYKAGRLTEKWERPKGEWLPFTYNYDLIEPSKYGSYVQILKDEKETHWEEYWGPEFVCSKCHAKNHYSNYCPYCGAEMRGKKNE